VKKFSLLMMILVAFCTLFLAGCGGKPEAQVKDIGASQTAFLIPKEGNTMEQGKFNSEEFVKSNLVAGKRIIIPSVYNEAARKYLPTHELIVVERAPQTREWTALPTSGTSTANQSIEAETKESISFYANMACSAQIEESDAPKFLYRYNGVQLAQVMDTEIRSMIAGKFIEESAQYGLDNLLLNKANIMKAVRDTVIPYFKDRGITITNLSLASDFTWKNKGIQDAIDRTFVSAESKKAQDNDNLKNVAKAKADAEVIAAQSSTLAQSIELKKAEAEVIRAQAMLEMGKNWRPTVLGDPVLNTMGFQKQ